jgi:hypothetical protein
MGRNGLDETSELAEQMRASPWGAMLLKPSTT